jgi:hypothetical protein
MRPIEQRSRGHEPTYLWLFLVISSALVRAAWTSGGNSWVLPTVFSRTPCSARMPLAREVHNTAPWRAEMTTHPCEQSSKSAFSAKFMSPSTSSFGRLKLSMAKAYTETTLTSRVEHISNTWRLILQSLNHAFVMKCVWKRTLRNATKPST